MRFTRKQVEQAVDKAKQVWYAADQQEKKSFYRSGLWYGLATGLVLGAMLGACAVLWLIETKRLALP